MTNQDSAKLEDKLGIPAPTTRKFKYGIVAALDALGVSSYGVDEAKNFLKQRDRVLMLIQTVVKPYLKEIHPLGDDCTQRNIPSCDFGC